MGRPGRYTLSVMAWVAAYAGWSTIAGLVAAALTRHAATGRSVSSGASAVFLPLLVAVPTVVALWFNDWARDGFPTREQRAAAVAPTPAATPAVAVPPATERTAPPVRVDGALPVVPAVRLGVPEGVPQPAGPGFPVAPALRD